MPMIKVMWANSEIEQFEEILINSDYIASVRVVSNNKTFPMCAIRLTTQREWLPVRATLEAIQDLIFDASQVDSQPNAPPWAAKP
jgi:hypothetical protein